MTPIPPTKSEIAAIDPRSTVSVFCVSVDVSMRGIEQGPADTFQRIRG